ncbi:uncharacterized protein LOC120354717 [Nilaparvata lugens]|uniref:uncharacterized protein LOC120354717 n=1 Tax=Nilaparvata lugens TaxID=108931 RepID=UPI00193D18B7|nr:uncharacterized protein LOC120354717 [Nilaparvata lugens]
MLNPSHGLVAGGAVQGQPVTLDQMNKLLDKLSDNLYQRLSTDISACKELLETNTQEISKQREQISNLLEENSRLKAKLRETELNQDELEQYSRRNTVEIFGVPEFENEDIAERIIGIAEALNVKLDATSIDACHRLPKRKNQATPAIVVRLVRRGDAEALLRNRRACKSFTTNDINVQGNNPIYLNKSLTAKRRKIFANAKMMLGDNDARRVWIDHAGRVKLRSVDGKVVKILRDEEDLSYIESSGTVINK